MSALCSLAFYAFFRVGEISTTTGPCNNLIQIMQLDRLVYKQGNVKTLQLSLCKYKHSVPGQPFVVYIYPEDICCPVQLILRYVSLRGHSPGRLFCWPDGKAISRTFFIAQLNAALKFNNLDSSIGTASWAAAKGFSDSQILLLGCWKSNAFLRYIRMPCPATSAS